LEIGHLIIAGAGAHGRVVLDIARDSGCWSHIEFGDDNGKLWGESINGARVGSLEEALQREPGSTGFVVTLGRPELRLALCRRIRAHAHVLMNVVHPSAVIESSAMVGSGIMISPMAVINSNAQLGDSVLVNTAALVEHDCVVGEGVSIAPGAILCGRVSVGCGAFICTRALVLPRVKIGAGAVVGAGSIVYQDVPDYTLAVGSPARPFKRIDESFDWARVL
jgi:sugar O-acyltransferase (sialic acid O-acetyltransferase NeuD family)